MYNPKYSPYQKPMLKLSEIYTHLKPKTKLSKTPVVSKVPPKNY